MKMIKNKIGISFAAIILLSSIFIVSSVFLKNYSKIIDSKEAVNSIGKERVQNKESEKENSASKGDKSIPTFKKKERESSSKSGCGISDIGIPMGSDSPVMSFSARVGSEEIKIYALNKDNINKVSIENSEMFHSDKNNNSVWYKNKNVSEEKIAKARDAFSFCRKIYQDYLDTGKTKNIEEADENVRNTPIRVSANSFETDLKKNKREEEEILRVKETIVEIPVSKGEIEGIKFK